MSCISSNFSSFFLNSLNDPSEFAKYLSNGEMRFSSEDFQVYGSGQVMQHQHNPHQNTNGNGNMHDPYNTSSPMETNYSTGPITTVQHHHFGQQSIGQNNNVQIPTQSGAASYGQQRWHNSAGHVQNTTHAQVPSHHTHPSVANTPTVNPSVATSSPAAAHHVSQANTNGHFDGSFEFLKYLRHSSDNATDATATSHATVGNNHQTTNASVAASSNSAASLIDLDSSTTQKSRSSRKVAALLSSVSRASNSLEASSSMDVFDHDSKHTIFDMQQHSNSNESSMEISNLAFPHSHMNASNSNTSSEGAAAGHTDFSILNNSAAAASNAPKPLATFTMKENFDVHPSHKVEEGIFQHMNKLPPKKKETLKQLGVRFTGQMTLNDKSIVVDNFIKFCQVS